MKEFVHGLLLSQGTTRIPILPRPPPAPANSCLTRFSPKFEIGTRRTDLKENEMRKAHQFPERAKSFLIVVVDGVANVLAQFSEIGCSKIAQPDPPPIFARDRRHCVGRVE
jgi:hypothetical protein